MMPTNTRNVMMTCLLTALAMAIVGCASSGDLQTTKAGQILMDGLTRSPQPPVYAERDPGTLAGYLLNGEAVFPPLSAALRRNVAVPFGGVSQPESGAAHLKSIAGDGAGGFRVTYALNGKNIPVIFTTGDRAQDPRYPGITHYFLARSDSDTSYYFWPWTEAVDGVAEFDYLDLYGWSVGGPENEFTGYSTYGLRTPAQELPLGNVVYEGRMRAELWGANEPRWHSQKSLVGTLNLAANLDDGNIAGRIDNLHVGPALGDAASHEPLVGDNWIDISSALIDKGGFTADWVGHGPERDTLPQDPAYHETMHGFAGMVIGEFYGPAGEEIGGVLSGRRGATDTAPEQFLVGGFGASRE